MYVACQKIRKKTEENKKDRKMGETIFSKKNNKYSTLSHLRQGLYTFFWSLKFKIMMHIEIYKVCQISILIFFLKNLEFSKTCRDLVLSE